MPAILHICVTCLGSKLKRDAEQPDAEPAENAQRPGALLLAAIENSELPEDIEVRAVECLSACDNGCSVALTYPGKWSYVYGHMTVDDVQDILTGSRAYSVSTDGLVPWRERPTVFRKQCISRLPPQG